MATESEAPLVEGCSNSYRRGVLHEPADYAKVVGVETTERQGPFADRHFAVIASAAVVVFVGVHVYFVSGFDIPTALTIMSVADRTAVVFSTVLYGFVALGPSLLIYLPSRRWILAGTQKGASPAVQIRTALVLLSLAAALLFILTIEFVVSLASLWSIIRVISWSRQRQIKASGKPSERPEPSYDLTWFLALLIGFTFVATLWLPWQAPESIVVSGEPKPLVGEVVGSQAGFVLVLGESQNLHWIPEGQVESRQVCARPLGNWLTWSGSTVLASRKAGAKC